MDHPSLAPAPASAVAAPSGGSSTSSDQQETQQVQVPVASTAPTGPAAALGPSAPSSVTGEGTTALSRFLSAQHPTAPSEGSSQPAAASEESGPGAAVSEGGSTAMEVDTTTPSPVNGKHEDKPIAPPQEVSGASLRLRRRPGHWAGLLLTATNSPRRLAYAAVAISRWFRRVPMPRPSLRERGSLL